MLCYREFHDGRLSVSLSLSLICLFIFMVVCYVTESFMMGDSLSCLSIYFYGCMLCYRGFHDGRLSPSPPSLSLVYLFIFMVVCYVTESFMMRDCLPLLPLSLSLSLSLSVSRLCIYFYGCMLCYREFHDGKMEYRVQVQARYSHTFKSCIHTIRILDWT